MFRKPILLSAAALLLNLTACGVGNFGNNPSPAAPAPASPSITGNWQIQTATSPTTATNFILLLGALQVSGTTVTGTFRISNLVPPNTCGLLNQVVTVTGTFSSANTLSLTSAPFASGSVLKVTLQVPPVPTTIGAGTLEIDGGNCAYASVGAIGGLIAPVNGTYLGTLAGQTGYPAVPTTPAAVTLVLGQAASPNPDGQFALTGTLQSVTGCTTVTPVTGTASGVGVQLASASGGTLPILAPVTVFGVVLSTATRFDNASIFYGPAPCASPGLSTASYNGTLTRQ